MGGVNPWQRVNRGLTHGRGLTESVRTLWVNSQHVFSLIYSAVTSLTDNQTVSSHQHEELGVTRQKRDAEDLDKISSWFKIHNPFDINRTQLQSLSTGLMQMAKLIVTKRKVLVSQFK